MIIIAGSPDVNVQKFIELIRESSCEFKIKSFDEWQQSKETPQGFIYIKVLPEISFKRLNKINPLVTLEMIQQTAQDLDNYFVHKTTMPHEYHTLQVLVLNGFVDFETDLSQFYNHLFYIKKIFGNYVPPKKHSCCGH